MQALHRFRNWGLSRTMLAGQSPFAVAVLLIAGAATAALGSTTNPQSARASQPPRTSVRSSSSSSSGSDACEQDLVQCGVSLTSISSWCVGQCGTRTTADPRVFGPFSWQTFHVFAQNYPTNPNAEARRACENFVTAIPYMVPCGHCGYDFQQFIDASVEHEGSYNSACTASKEYDMPCQGPKTACRNQANLVNFFLRAHNNVDKHTKPCKAPWSPAMAAETYTNQSGFCASGIVWGSVAICKSTDCEPN